MSHSKACLWALGLLVGLSSCKSTVSQLPLAGKWDFSLDSTDVGASEGWATRDFSQTISLPGTTDDAGYGIPNKLAPALTKPQVLHLTRKNSYIGPAWYCRDVEIPAGWKGKGIELKLERVIWKSSVWVDGKKVEGDQNSLIAPHVYDLSKLLTPGKHRIAVLIDNRKQYDISGGDMAHAYTNETQIMWNGIIGEISLTAKDAASIDDLQVYPDYKDKKLTVKCVVKNTGKATSGKLVSDITSPTGEVVKVSKLVELIPGENTVEFTAPITGDIKAWGEFSPNLYTLTTSLKAGSSKDSEKVKFGFRDLQSKGESMTLNGNRIFLRGTLECCIFPLTGYPPMTHEGWLKVFNTARAWGLNHLRFHSWCPPKAAFEVADSLGFYLQVELPLWQTNLVEDKRAPYLYAEADRILKEYGNHPSFCLFSLGNELQSDFNFLAKLLKHVKSKDSRRLFTTTSFTFEGGHGDWPEKGDDYLVTQWTKKGWVRGQGVFNSEAPNFSKDYSASVNGVPVPIVTHEIGQYAVYPDLKEIPKYEKGVLDPLNFKGVKQDLERKGLIDKADDYLMASGKLAALLYKEEIERAMKTNGITGFQLLDLHDFPGQGTALVGLLNAFWDSKGVADAKTFRQSCSEVTPLARFPKAAYTSDETFTAGVEVANYGAGDIKNAVVSWKLSGQNGETFAEGKFPARSLALGGNRKVGDMSCSLNKATKAQALTFSVAIDGTNYKNEWKIWVYPSNLSIDKGNVVVTDNFAEAEKSLKEGKKVLFNPSFKKFKGVEGRFVPVFWSPVHFPTQAGTMGLLLNPQHPAFASFPTEAHTDWQWWHLATRSKTLCIDSLYKEVTPLVEVVDNFASNRRLTNLFETKCLNGSLVVCSMDIINQQADSPEQKQMLYSLLEYMKSDAFNPSTRIAPETVAGLVETGK